LDSIKRKRALEAVLNSKNNNLDTPLMAAIAKDSLELVQALLKYSQFINIQFQDFESGYTALHKCLLRGNLRMAVLILSYFQINSEIKDHERMTYYQLLQV
jgi:ankyrin repeat protein